MHSVVTTAANVADSTVLPELLHGEERMNGTVNTNDQSPHGPVNQPVAGGVSAQAVCPNDNQQINTANPTSAAAAASGVGR